MNNNYWLERVISKLYSSFLNGNVLSEWIPDDEDNDAESRALDTLEIAGIIASPGGWEGTNGTRIVDLQDGFARTDATRRIAIFEYEKFIRFCELNGLNPTYKGVLAQLEIVDDVQPVIIIDDKRYALKSLNDSGLPQKVIAYAWNNLNRRISLDELRKNISMVQIQKEDASLKQTFDKKNIFGKNGILQTFAEIDVRSFLLKRDTLLSPNEIAEIKLASTN